MLTPVRWISARRLGPGGRALALAVSLGLVAAGVAGCGASAAEGAGGTSGPAEGGFGWFAYSDPDSVAGQELGTPVDAVERAGLRLPDHASWQRVETRSFTGFTESYLFVFQVDAATAAGLCGHHGLPGAGPVPADQSDIRMSMDDPSVSAGSRWCQGTSPTDPRWSRRVLIDAGNPATVHLSLQRRDPTPGPSTPASVVTAK